MFHHNPDVWLHYVSTWVRKHLLYSQIFKGLIIVFITFLCFLTTSATFSSISSVLLIKSSGISHLLCSSSTQNIPKRRPQQKLLKRKAIRMVRSGQQLPSPWGQAHRKSRKGGPRFPFVNSSQNPTSYTCWHNAVRVRHGNKHIAAS